MAREGEGASVTTSYNSALLCECVSSHLKYIGNTSVSPNRKEPASKSTYPLKRGIEKLLVPASYVGCQDEAHIHGLNTTYRKVNLIAPPSTDLTLRF